MTNQAYGVLISEYLVSDDWESALAINISDFRSGVVLVVNPNADAITWYVSGSPDGVFFPLMTPDNLSQLTTQVTPGSSYAIPPAVFGAMYLKIVGNDSGGSIQVMLKD